MEPDHVQMTKVNCRLKVNCTYIPNILQFNLCRWTRRLKFGQNNVGTHDYIILLKFQPPS